MTYQVPRPTQPHRILLDMLSFRLLALYFTQMNCDRLHGSIA
jgi:hypothetical protein